MRKALLRRAEVHTSGWQEKNGKPVVAVGPVREGAAHWHRDEKVKPMPAAWPFAAVLEYDGEGKPEAYVDWFRRAKDSGSADGCLARLVSAWRGWSRAALSPWWGHR